MLNANDHDKLLDLWETFADNVEPRTVAQQDLYRDLEIALGLVRCATNGRVRQEAIDRCLLAWTGGTAKTR